MVDISPEAWNPQDKIHRPNEAQEEQSPEEGRRCFCSSEKGNKILKGENMQINMQRLKQRPSKDCSSWGFMPYIVTKSQHYRGCQEMLADRSLLWLSHDVNTEADAHSQLLD